MCLKRFSSFLFFGFLNLSVQFILLYESVQRLRTSVWQERNEIFQHSNSIRMLFNWFSHTLDILDMMFNGKETEKSMFIVIQWHKNLCIASIPSKHILYYYSIHRPFISLILMWLLDVRCWIRSNKFSWIICFMGNWCEI